MSTLLAAVVALGVAATVAEWSPWSGSAPSGALAAAAPPSSVRIVGVTEHSVAFRWSTPLTDASVVAFEIVRDGAVADVVMPVQSTYDATGLGIGRTYRFEVVAVYAGSVSAPSAPIVATTGP